jgi:hypothetical protein
MASGIAEIIGKCTDIEDQFCELAPMIQQKVTESSNL